MRLNRLGTLAILVTLLFANRCLEATKAERGGGGDDGGRTYDAGHDAVPDSSTDSGASDGGASDGGDEDYNPPPPDGDDTICPAIMCGPSVDPCMEVVFNPHTCNCDEVAGADGMFCDDGDPCTDMDECRDGACTGGMPVPGCGGCMGITCDEFPGMDCEKMILDPETCTCYPDIKPDGALCDDGDPCTMNDHCEDGFCEPGPPDPSCGLCDHGLPSCESNQDCPGGAVCNAGCCVWE
jgi:hypothetical protein